MQRTHGFTLVELSIVLVIIGLLTGGVLTGQSLIRAAELRSVSAQYSRYITAVQTFRDKYFAIPGDMPNATKYWTQQSAGTACATAASSGPATCDGNGDGALSNIGTSNERFRFWQHLANAGMIEGSYNGISMGSTDESTTTANAPVGKISSSIWYATNRGTLPGDTSMFAGQYDNTIMIGGVLLNSWPGKDIFKPEDAYNIDTKMDDGKPGTGKLLMVTFSGFSSCTNTTDPTNLNALYNLTNTGLVCTLIFRQAF